MSDYTGKVTVGGPADVRRLPGLEITKVAVGPMDNNAYLLRDTASGDALLIDAANEAARLVREIGDVPVRQIVTTHRHQDHWQALAEVVKHTGARTLAHPLDAGSLPVPVDQLVENGAEITVGETPLTVIHLRGHTPGAVALLYRPPDGAPHLFTGDSLFPGGPGRTESPQAFTSLMDDLEERVFGPLPDETWVYPGHGNDTTLGAERPAIPEWRARGW